uniref:RING-type domain-containing protein n=1 Tax=Oryza barthii TaxID=65489 RepID=A0A0D3FZB0_9ORYZ
MAEGWASSSALQHRRPEFRAIPPMAIEEALPVVRFDDEVRRLSNCRHVFHRGCLDRWIEHDDQRTCPLCRAPLIPDEMAGALWAAAGVPDASDFDFSYFGAPLTPMPTPTLLRPHELLLTGLGGYQ